MKKRTPVRHSFLITYNLYWWSCGESNPGPNEEAIRFLHAYPRFGFRMKNGSRPPIFTLSPLFRRLAGASSRLFPILLHFLIGPLRINSTREMSHSSILCRISSIYLIRLSGKSKIIFANY